MTLPAGLFERPFAHRGLWATARPENSLSAFEAACRGGYGIELDVQLTADGDVVVFHDETLERMTNHAGIVEERPVAELVRMRLKGGDQTIPTLAQALDLVAGRAPVLIELKTPRGQEGHLEARVDALVEGYRGPFALIGFNALSHAWLAAHHCTRPRGFTVQDLGALDLVPLARPQFLNIRLDLLASAAVRRRRAGGLPVIAWTVRNESERESAAWDCDNYIFEDMAP